MAVKSVLRKPTATVSEEAPSEFEQKLGAKGVIDVESEPADGEPSDAPTPSPGLPVKSQAGPASIFVASSGGALEGEWDEGDIKLPQLKIVNGSGKLSQTFNQGTLLYADEELFAPPNLKDPKANPVLRFIPVKLFKQYRQRLTQEEVEDGGMPMIVNTLAEVAQHGGTVGFEGDWAPSARCLLLLEQPEGNIHPGFNLVLGDKNYAPAVYYAGGMAWTHFAKKIMNIARTHLTDMAGNQDYCKRFWEFRVVKAGTKFTVFVPAVSVTRDEVSADVRKMCGLVSGSNNVAPEE